MVMDSLTVVYGVEACLSVKVSPLKIETCIIRASTYTHNYSGNSTIQIFVSSSPNLIISCP